MHIICMTPLAEGVYNDHKADHITTPPEGWAYIPEDFPLPSTFPCLGSIEAEMAPYSRKVTTMGSDGNIATEEREDIILTVVSMTEGTLPDPEPVPEPDPETESAIWDELDAAYQEGVDSV